MHFVCIIASGKEYVSLSSFLSPLFVYFFISLSLSSCYQQIPRMFAGLFGSVWSIGLYLVGSSFIRYIQPQRERESDDPNISRPSTRHCLFIRVTFFDSRIYTIERGSHADRMQHVTPPARSGYTTTLLSFEFLFFSSDRLSPLLYSRREEVTPAVH